MSKVFAPLKMNPELIIRIKSKELKLVIFLFDLVLNNKELPNKYNIYMLLPSSQLEKLLNSKDKFLLIVQCDNCYFIKSYDYYMWIIILRQRECLVSRDEKFVSI